MTKTEIRKDLESKFGRAGFLNQKQIAEYIGSGINYPKELMVDCHFIRRGRREKLYSVDDIANRLIELRTY